jgi:alkanesulfonate monooxygenase SsuD/methylene tetrahydromethanopterin reductase-like flavin-dependent oxidoreductase (luciferase family)
VSAGPLRFGMTFVRQDDWERIVERVERYEVMGLDSAWVADHFVFPWDPTGPWLEAWALLGGLAGRTRRIQLGTMVSHVIYRNPAVLARTAMTVDRISNGRLQLGARDGRVRLRLATHRQRRAMASRRAS